MNTIHCFPRHKTSAHYKMSVPTFSSLLEIDIAFRYVFLQSNDLLLLYLYISRHISTV